MFYFLVKVLTEFIYLNCRDRLKTTVTFAIWQSQLVQNKLLNECQLSEDKVFAHFFFERTDCFFFSSKEQHTMNVWISKRKGEISTLLTFTFSQCPIYIKFVLHYNNEIHFIDKIFEKFRASFEKIYFFYEKKSTFWLRSSKLFLHQTSVFSDENN